MNRVFLIGHLGENPEFHMTRENGEMAILSLATDTSWKDLKGQWQKWTSWHTVSILSEGMVRYTKASFHKGDKILVEGQLSYHERQDKNGTKYRTAKVLVLGPKCGVQLLRSAKELTSTTLSENEQQEPFQESDVDPQDTNLENLDTPHTLH